MTAQVAPQMDLSICSAAERAFSSSQLAPATAAAPMSTASKDFPHHSPQVRLSPYLRLTFLKLD